MVWQLGGELMPFGDRQDLRAQVRMITRDLNGQLVTDAEINQLLDEGMRDICSRSEMADEHWTTPSAVGTFEYSLPPEFISFFEDSVLYDRKPVRAALKEEEFLLRNADGNKQRGTPEIYMIFGGFLYLHPTPDAIKTIEADGLRPPADFASDNDFCELQDRWLKAIVRYVASECFRRMNVSEARQEGRQVVMRLYEGEATACRADYERAVDEATRWAWANLPGRGVTAL